MEQDKKAISIIVDAKTAEIVGELYDGDKIVRKKQMKYYKDNEENIVQERMYDFGQGRSFTMFNEKAGIELTKEGLTASDYNVLFLLVSNTNYKSGLIALGNNRPVSQEWLVKTLNINKKTVTATIRKLIDKGIIAENTTNNHTKYFFNPYIQYKGRWINKTLYEMFKNTKWSRLNRYS